MRTDIVNVLDHGYVRFIESWGFGLSNTREAGIIEAARQSTEGSFRGWDQDEKLLKFLYTSNPKHASPFEFAGLVLEIQAPIFVFREWHRHRTQSYNELSARYTPLPDMNYCPDLVNLFNRAIAAQTSRNRQASSTKTSGEELKAKDFDLWTEDLKNLYKHAQAVYDAGLALGVPKELARLPVPVARYSRMRASANLRNWLAFLTLRMDPGAQWEIRQYANAVGEIISREFPKTWSLFELRGRIT